MRNSPPQTAAPRTQPTSRFFLCLSQNTQPIGPFTVEECRELVRSGRLDEHWFHAPEGAEHWQPLTGSPLWHEIRPPFIRRDEMIDTEPPPSRRKSQRTRDYLRLLVFGNVLLMLLAKLFIVLNPVSLMFLAAGLVMYNVALVWFMFVILKEY